jgi:hypothetical protein
MTAPALLVASFGNRQASTAPTQAAVALAAHTRAPSGTALVGTAPRLYERGPVVKSLAWKMSEP